MGGGVVKGPLAGDTLRGWRVAGFRGPATVFQPNNNHQTIRHYIPCLPCPSRYAINSLLSSHRP